MKEPERIEKIINNISPKARRLLKTILELEKEKLYMSKPWVKDDILAAFRREIK